MRRALHEGPCALERAVLPPRNGLEELLRANKGLLCGAARAGFAAGLSTFA